MRSHAVIAGTGRAGTSFLVRFLRACGLDAGEDGEWFDRARAGLEHRLFAEPDLPYVVKDPWLFAYCDSLALDSFAVDALLVPMRDLMVAAQSRVHQERLAFAESWMGTPDGSQVAGVTPGGVLYSLDVVDQARILAVGLHKLLHWAAANELPLYVLHFPRLVEDPDYLVRALQPWLGEHCTVDVARRAFAETANEGAIRFRPPQADEPHAFPLDAPEPDPAALDRAALAERIAELHARSAELEQALASIRASRTYRALAPVRALGELVAQRRA